MDKKYLTSLIVGFALINLFSSCTDKCETLRTYIFFEPVYKNLDEVRAGFKIAGPRELNNTGKIYLYDHYLFINEAGEGVHIIDNNDKNNPVIKKFITIPGNFDIAVKENVLYADSYLDLLAIDISDLDNIKLLERLVNVFPNYNTQFGFVAEPGMVIAGWEEKETIELSNDCRYTGGGIFPLGFGVAMDAASVAFESSSPASPAGIGGSIARFAIYSNYLYAVDFYNMNVFNIFNTQSPKQENIINVGWNVETIFPYKDKLFIGSQNGMFIYDNSNPAEPAFLSNFSHATACDPVVANDEYAFVTLRSGSACDGFANQLDIIDIRNITNPMLISTVNLTNPFGLGLDGNTLFICDGDSGLKVFDITDINAVASNMIMNFPEINVFDVIPWDNTLLAIGEDGLYQYDYSDVTAISLISFIPVTRDSE